MAKQAIPRLVEENLHHRARVGGVSFNPFTLRLQASEFALETIEGRPVLGFADAVVDLEWRSLLRGAWVFSEVRLVDSSAHVEVSKDGRLNLAALAPDKGTAPSPQPTRFAIGTFSVANGSLDFEDQREGYRNRLEHLSIELSSLSTLGEQKGPYAIAGQTPGGATLHWKGELSLAPLEATGSLAVENAALAELMPYVDDFTAVRIVAGRADLELPYRFALPGGKPLFALKNAKLHVREPVLAGTKQSALLAKLGAISLAGVDFDSGAQHASVTSLRIGESTIASGADKGLFANIGPLALEGAAFDLGARRLSARTLSISNAALAAGDDKRSLAKLGQLALESLEFRLDSQSASAKRLRVADLMLALQRDADGGLDIARLFAGNRGDATSGAKPTEWRLGIGSVEIANASARYTDYTAKTPLALTVRGVDTGFSLEAASGAGGLLVRVDAGKSNIAKLDAVAASASSSAARQPAVNLAMLSLDGARFDSDANALDIQAVRIGSLGMDTALENGRPSLLDLLPAKQDSKSEKPLSARMKTFELGGGTVHVADRATGLALVLDRLATKLTDTSTDGAKPLAFALNAEVKSGGRIALRGRAVPAKGVLEAKVDANAIAMAPVQPLLSRLSSLRLGSGDASLSGTLRIGGKDAKFVYSGAASIANLALDDPAGVRLIGWKSLAAESLKATLSPDDVDIDELRITAPAGRLAIATDGTSNISRAFADKQATADRQTTALTKADAAPPIKPEEAPAAAAEEAKPGEGAPFPFAVRRVRIEQGALDFSDESLSPSFVAKIYELAGTANGLSSDRDSRSQFSLEGRVDEFGYARLSGSVNPFAPRNRSTFRVQLRNIDLASASPYAMRFAGYRIATGHLALDLNYRVRDSLIEGDNNITLEDLTLGERVESPNALKLPFELAIALLKDPDGRINLEVPVRGNLDDPQFSLAPLIWKAVGNLIGSIVTAPFRALAHLFGGGSQDDAGMIAFDPGRSRLLPPEREKLGRIAQVLAKRPEVKLLIPAHYDAEADSRAMKRTALGRELGRRAGFSVAEDEEPGPVNIEDKPTRAALRALYAERFSRTELVKLRTQAEEKARAAGKPAPSVTDRVRNFVSGEPQIADAREFYQALLRQLRETQPLSSNALAELAGQRARAIESALIAAGADASRIAQTTAEPAAEADAKQVTVHLLLTAR